MESLPRVVSEQLSLRRAPSDKSDPQKGYSQHSHRPTASRRACGSAHSRATSGRMLAAMARPASADMPSNGLSSKSQTLTLQKSDFRNVVDEGWKCSTTTQTFDPWLTLTFWWFHPAGVKGSTPICTLEFAKTGSKREVATGKVPLERQVRTLLLQKHGDF